MEMVLKLNCMLKKYNKITFKIGCSTVNDVRPKNI